MKSKSEKDEKKNKPADFFILLRAYFVRFCHFWWSSKTEYTRTSDFDFKRFPLEKQYGGALDPYCSNLATVLVSTWQEFR